MEQKEREVRLGRGIECPVFLVSEKHGRDFSIIKEADFLSQGRCLSQPRI